MSNEGFLGLARVAADDLPLAVPGAVVVAFFGREGAEEAHELLGLVGLDLEVKAHTAGGCGAASKWRHAHASCGTGGRFSFVILRAFKHSPGFSSPRLDRSPFWFPHETHSLHVFEVSTRAKCA